MKRADSPTLSTGRVLALVASLVLVVAPHAIRVPIWITAIVATSVAIRGVLAWRGYGLPKSWMLAVLALASAAGIWLSYGMLFGRDAAVGLLVLMLCLKLMELKTNRDAIVVILLGYFLVITNFLYSQTIPMALYLVACVWFITACLMSFQHRVATPSPARLLKHSGVLLAQAAPLMLVLFLLFPRVNGPLWGMPQATAGAMTGLSDSMSPGTMSALGLSDAVAFRVEFITPPPPAAKLYWRGPVMWEFDGRTWRAGDQGPLVDDPFESIGEPMRYTVTLEPHNMRWLFAAELPAQRFTGGLLTADYQMLAIRPVRNRMRYEMTSYPTYRFGKKERREVLTRALQLPEGFNPKAIELARQWSDQSANGRELVNRALRYFREQPFYYTLTPPALGRDSVDEFVFGTRRGFCEHYASSFVVMMRAAGLPARVVTGYQGGVLNPVGNYMIVRQADAHAWAEVWIEGEGWVRIDPTSAVSPARIESGIAAALPAEEPLPGLLRADNAFVQKMRFALDAVTNSWNQWVLGYTAERQMRMLAKVSGQKVTWRNLAIVLMVITALVVAVLSFSVLRRLTWRKSDPLSKAWMSFSRKLQSKGLARLPSEGPLDYTRRVAFALPHRAASINAIGSLYADLRYGPPKSRRELAQFEKMVRAFRAT